MQRCAAEPVRSRQVIGTRLGACFTEMLPRKDRSRPGEVHRGRASLERSDREPSHQVVGRTPHGHRLHVGSLGHREGGRHPEGGVRRLDRDPQRHSKPAVMDRDVRQGLRPRGDRNSRIAPRLPQSPLAASLRIWRKHGLHHARAGVPGRCRRACRAFPATGGRSAEGAERLHPQHHGCADRRLPVRSRPHRGVATSRIHPPPGLDRVPEYSAVAAAFAGDLRRLLRRPMANRTRDITNTASLLAELWTRGCGGQGPRKAELRSSDFRRGDGCPGPLAAGRGPQLLEFATN